MLNYRFFIKNCIIFILSVGFISSQESRPKFPDVFEVQVEGIFMEEKAEVDGSLFYDRLNNRAVLAFTYENVSKTTIYNFNDNQQIYIEGVECSVSNITEQIYFKYTFNETTGKKTIASPEEIFFFTNSVFNRQELSIFPSYVYTATVDVPLYGLKNCELTHIFSKPELEMPDCDGHACRSTLVSISVKCPPPEHDKEIGEIFHIYNFYRFRFDMKDESVFQPPVGVYCEVVNKEPFPYFPEYFSLTYSLVEEKKDSVASGVDTIHRKVYYDTRRRLIRIDELNKGYLISSKIFDFHIRVAYNIMARIPDCNVWNFEQNITVANLTRLPKVFFASTAEDAKDAVYIGKRTVHGLDFEVWALSIMDDESEVKVVQEFYFTNNNPKDLREDNYLQLSHADIYTYKRDHKTGIYSHYMQTYLSVSNFRFTPKEWTAFDISPCFKAEHKKEFQLKVKGPPVVPNTILYEDILEKLYMRLVNLTNMSVTRISQLKGKFDGTHISEFSGWILNKLERKGLNDNEPSMDEAYNIIEKAAADGILSVSVKKDDTDQMYTVTAVTSDPEKCISGGTFGLVGLLLLFMGITFGFVGYYVFFRRKARPILDKVELHNMAE